jgi:tyrosyl-tRNA synthetase
VQPIIVLGGTTGSIGDPSGRDSERQSLNPGVVNSNLEAIRNQIEDLLHNIRDTLGLDNLPKPIFINNKDIYANMSIMEFMREIGRYVRVGGLLNREMIKKRLNSEEGISYQEFSYQLFQAYDFLWLNEKYNCNLQLGGSDQWGNICAGCELIRKIKNKEVFGMTYPLLVNARGEKYGKSMVRVLSKVG